MIAMHIVITISTVRAWNESFLLLRRLLCSPQTYREVTARPTNAWREVVKADVRARDAKKRVRIIMVARKKVTLHKLWTVDCFFFPKTRTPGARNRAAFASHIAKRQTSRWKAKISFVTVAPSTTRNGSAVTVNTSGLRVYFYCTTTMSTASSKCTHLTLEQRQQLDGLVCLDWETLEERRDRQWGEIFQHFKAQRREKLNCDCCVPYKRDPEL